jgi:Cache domain
MPSGFPSINRRVLTVVLIVALPILVLGARYVVETGYTRVRDAEVARLGQVADHIASSADAYVFRRIVDASVIARVPEIRRVAAEGTRQPVDQKKTEAIDQQWQKERKVPAAVAGVLSNDAARFLSDVVKQDQLYREILVADRHGRIVAASQVTTDYYQADEGWFTQALDDGRRGRITVSDVRRDESADVYAFDISVPVAGPESDELVGIMKIVASSQEMLQGIGGLQLGSTGQVMLIRQDGSIVFSRQAMIPGSRFFGADILKERLTASENDPQARVSFRSRSSDGTDRVVAVARSRLQETFPNLSWLVAVSMEESELLQPFRPMVGSLMVVIGLTIIGVLAVALWASMRLARPAFDPSLDMHLVEHPKPPRIEEG